MSDLSDIKSFLKINADDHIQNNLIFDDFVRKCVSYMKLFNDQSVNKSGSDGPLLEVVSPGGDSAKVIMGLYVLHTCFIHPF